MSFIAPPFRWPGRARLMLAAGLLLSSLGWAQGNDDSRAVNAVLGNGPDATRTTREVDRSFPSSTDGSSSSVGFGNALITFYPPTPPFYGSTLPETPERAVIANGRKLVTPDELADFVGEIFYPALGTRLHERSVGRKLETALVAYRAARMALLDELMLELYRVQHFPRAEREAALHAFAPRQHARIEALERDAERLRRELAEGGLFSKKLTVDDGRRWRLTEVAVANPPVKSDAERHVARVTAYFQEGLLIEQRGLLLELAMEAARSARVVRGRRGVSDDDPAAGFFSPETSRVRLPSPLPPALFAKVGAFNSEKAALKRELLQSLVECDSFSPAKRAGRYAALATAQQPRLAALEALAEEIRRGLDALGDPPAPWVPPIPPELRERIEGYNRERLALVAAFAAAQRRAATASRYSLLATAPAEHGETREDPQRRRAEALREAGRLFEMEHAEQIGTLQRRYERIRSDLADVARDTRDPHTRREMTVETLLDAYRVAMQRFDTIGREEAMYERYKLAMLQPGLSPGQRRLLFRAAHANLAQALPSGEISSAISSRPRPVY